MGTAANSIAKRTGKVSAGTSSFVMIVPEKADKGFSIERVAGYGNLFRAV